MSRFKQYMSIIQETMNQDDKNQGIELMHKHLKEDFIKFIKDKYWNDISNKIIKNKELAQKFFDHAIPKQEQEQLTNAITILKNIFKVSSFQTETIKQMESQEKLGTTTASAANQFFPEVIKNLSDKDYESIFLTIRQNKANANSHENTEHRIKLGM